MYVLDGVDQRVYRFSTNGKQLETYGAGQGIGPGQHMRAAGFGVTADSSVVIGDTKGRRISVFGAGGSLKETLHPDKLMLRCTVTAENKVTYLTAPTAVYFQALSDGRIEKAAPLVRDPMKWMAALDGGLRPDAKGGVIQFAFYFNVLIRWAPDGTIDYIRRLVGAYPPTPLTDATMGKRVRTSGVQYRVNDVAVHNSKIHVLVIFFEEDGRRHVVDVYDLEEGAYEYSYRYPEYVRGIARGPNRIVGLKDTTFVVWNLLRGEKGHDEG